MWQPMGGTAVGVHKVRRTQLLGYTSRLIDGLAGPGQSLEGKQNFRPVASGSELCSDLLGTGLRGWHRTCLRTDAGQKSGGEYLGQHALGGPVLRRRCHLQVSATMVFSFSFSFIFYFLFWQWSNTKSRGSNTKKASTHCATRPYRSGSDN